jgi:predicted RNase H-like nuclease (RuvC/YqgF family)
MNGTHGVHSKTADTVDEEIAALSSRINQLVVQNSELSFRIDQLEQEVNELNSQLASYQSIRSLVKALLIRIDFLIQESIYPSRYRRQLKLAPQDAELTLHNEVLEQLKAINEYDKINLSKIKIASHPIRASTLGIYRKIRRLAIRILGISLLALRKIKRMALRR